MSIYKEEKRKRKQDEVIAIIKEMEEKNKDKDAIILKISKQQKLSIGTASVTYYKVRKTLQK